ncbi:MAG: nuclear transport factor 2 family protein [Pseudomonadota bacterium]
MSAIETFFSGWGADDSTRVAAVTAAFGSSVYYADPQCPAPMTDVSALEQMVAMFGQHMPGGSAEVVKIDAHNGHARATVAFTKDGVAMMHGHYFADFDADEKLVRLVGFPGLGTPE